MRKIAAALLGCLVLAGCGASSWQGELRFKVSEIVDYQPHESMPLVKRVDLDLLGEMPEDALERDNFRGTYVEQDEISGGEVKVGDEVICTAKQEKDGPIQTNTMPTRLSGCKKA